MATRTTVYAQGTGTIYSAAVNASPLEATWAAQMVSLKGTLKILQEEGEVKESFIDQNDLPITVVKSSGKVTIEWSFPNTAKASWEKFYNTVTTSSPATGDFAGMDVVGVKLTNKSLTDMLRVDMKEGGQKFVFPSVDWSTLFAKEDDDNPTLFKVKVTVKAAEGEGADFYVLNPTTV